MLVRLLLVLLLPLAGFGALDFSGADNDRVNHGSAAILDDMDPVTYILWFNPDNLTASLNFLYGKFNAAGNARAQMFYRSNGRLAYWRSYASATMQRESDNSFITATTWQMVAVVGNGVTNTDNKIYRGTLTSTVAEATYAVSNSGTGALLSDADGDLFIANNTPTSGLSPDGKIGFVMIVKAALTIDQIRALQIRPTVVANTVLFSTLGYNAVNAPDWSGNANNGTVTGATLDTVGLPLPALYSMWPSLRDWFQAKMFWYPTRMHELLG